MADSHRANYALVQILEQLGPSEDTLDVPWAEFSGNRTSTYEFTVPTDDVTDVYLEIQAYDVDAYGHDILINDDSLTGFDVPPHNGWQYWMDAVTGAELQAGENAIQVRRDSSTTDAFAVGNIVVNWKEPVE